jgi:hypothetical protein
MHKRRLRVVKWLSTTPAVGVCMLCSQEFKVPMSAFRRTADAQTNLQEQFDRHKCTADILLRQEPDEDDDEEEDDDKEDGDDDDEGDDGYSE